MRHKAKIDLWFAIAIVFAVVVPVAQEHYWIALPPVLILVTCCCPQSYETTTQGLMVRAGFVRRLIPYGAITFILDHPMEIEAYLADQDRRYEEIQARYPLTPDMIERFERAKSERSVKPA